MNKLPVFFSIIIVLFSLTVSSYTFFRNEVPSDTNDNGQIAMTFEPERNLVTGNIIRSQDFENSEDGPLRNFVEDEYFSFTLKEPLFDRISREDALHYREPGWTIMDSRNREVDVYIDIPSGMRRQIPGIYEITYKAFLENDQSGEPLGTQKRTCQVFDINECETGTHECSQNADCIYLENGGYKCECKPGYRGTGKICNDIDECAEGTAVCDMHSTCINTPGSYVCECNPGFHKVGDHCEDIDECATGAHDCSPFAICKNLPGHFVCKCKDGYEGNGKTCTPINKCSSGDINCHPYATCIVVDEDEFKCVCREGYRGDGINFCEDIDECAEGTYSCPVHSQCRNTYGGYTCVCDPGFQEVDNQCEDIDECALHIDNCPPNSRCFNTIGGYRCECIDGYVKDEDGRCQDFSGAPSLTLKGDNPMRIKLFDTYSEPGFMLEDEKEEMSFLVNIPPKLNGIARHCGTFEITYRAIDRASGKETVKTRVVIVEEIDICQLPNTHPFSNKCHEYARCIFLQGECNYACQCPYGYEGDGFGIDGCKDTVPPVFVYDGPEPYLREVCVVCGSAISMPNLMEPIITKAYDNTPFGRKDISDRILLETEPSPRGDDCLIHHYSVVDDSGNIARKDLTVCLKVEDMRTIIMEMKAMYSWQTFLIRNVAAFCALAFVLFCVWEFGSRFASCFRVITGANPSHDDKDTAYSLWYRLRNPLASQASVRRYANSKILLADDDEEDDYSDSESEYDSDESDD